MKPPTDQHPPNPMENPVEGKEYNFAKEEEAILEYWNSISAFEQQLSLSEANPEYIFYDGPPFATGLPHYGHILAGTLKVRLCLLLLYLLPLLISVREKSAEKVSFLFHLPFSLAFKRFALGYRHKICFFNWPSCEQKVWMGLSWSPCGIRN